MAGSYRYSAALDKTYVEQRWACSIQGQLPQATAGPAVRTAVLEPTAARAPVIKAVAPSVPDALRFVKPSQAPLGRQPREKLAPEPVRKKSLASQDEQEEQWLTHLDEWKSRRRKASQKAFQRVQEAKLLFPDSEREYRLVPSPPPQLHEPTLTTSTELLSEYSTKPAPQVLPLQEPIRKAPIVVQETYHPPQPVPEPRRKEVQQQSATPSANPPSNGGRQENTTEGTLSVSGRRPCSHCNQPLGESSVAVSESCSKATLAVI